MFVASRDGTKVGVDSIVLARMLSVKAELCYALDDFSRTRTFIRAFRWPMWWQFSQRKVGETFESNVR